MVKSMLTVSTRVIAAGRIDASSRHSERGVHAGTAIALERIPLPGFFLLCPSRSSFLQYPCHVAVYGDIEAVAALGAARAAQSSCWFEPG